jgi:hypothetical protein
MMMMHVAFQRRLYDLTMWWSIVWQELPTLQAQLSTKRPRSLQQLLVDADF